MSCSLSVLVTLFDSLKLLRIHVYLNLKKIVAGLVKKSEKY